MRPFNLYLDTSVWNYAVAQGPPEKQLVTRELLQAIRSGVHHAFVSAVVIDEITQAPPRRRLELERVLHETSPRLVEIIPEVIALAEQYVEARIIPLSKRNDALHIAAATVADMEGLVSWNDKHLANLRVKEKSWSTVSTSGKDTSSQSSSSLPWRWYPMKNVDKPLQEVWTWKTKAQRKTVRMTAQQLNRFYNQLTEEATHRLALSRATRQQLPY